MGPSSSQAGDALHKLQLQCETQTTQISTLKSEAQTLRQEVGRLEVCVKLVLVNARKGCAEGVF